MKRSMFMRSAICKWVCFIAAHKISPNPAFERDSPRSGRVPQFYVMPHRSLITIGVHDFRKSPWFYSDGLSLKAAGHLNGHVGRKWSCG